jgi:tape measure domain-containing protein
MDNKLEYIISIIDKATAPMAKFGQSAIAHFTKIEDAQKKFARSNELAGKSFDSLGKQIDALKAKAHGIEIISNSDIAKVRAMNSAVKDLERQQSKIGNMNGSKLKGWATDAASQIPGAGLISNPLVMGGMALAGVVKAGIGQENSRMAIQGLSGSAEKGNKFFSQARDYAVSTSYSQKGVLDAGQGMLANGMGGDAAMNTIKMLGDVAMGSDEKLASLANMMSRVNITGYLQGDELNSLVEAGFNPLKEISDATGESYASLKKKMEDGGISMGMVQGALARLTGEGGRMHGMAEKTSKTFGGQLNTMMEQFMKTAATIGEAILPILNVALGVLNTALEFIVENGDVLAVIIGTVGLSMLLAGGSATGYAIGMELASIATNIASSAVYKFGVALLTTPIGWL